MNAQSLYEQLEAMEGDIYETAISASIQIEDDADEARWFIGDVACLLETRYGENVIEQFAIDMNLGKKTAFERRAMAQFYPRDVRNALRADAPSLRWSHFRRAKSLGDLDEALNVLQRASENCWTVEQLGLAVRAQSETPFKRQKVGEFTALLDGHDRTHVTFVLSAENELPDMDEDTQYIISIYQLIENKFEG